MHVWGAAQTLPQPPQFFPSEVGSMHAAAQEMNGAPHDTAQVPALQNWAVAQACPQPPQLAGSLSVLTHCPLHEAKLSAH